MALKIAIAEDKPFLLDSLVQEITQKTDFEICLKASDGQDFLDKLSLFSLEALPKVVLMDINMPYLNGIQTTEKLKKIHPNMHVIMLTVFDEEDMIFKAILAGANGYLLKDEPTSKIIQAIEDVENGGAQMSPEIAMKALNFLRNPVPSPKKSNKYLSEDDLTPREIEVLQKISQGFSYKETAECLFVSLDTVRSHLKNIYLKLYARNKTEAINEAKKRGWI